MLRQNGYMTAWIGKNHNTPAWEASEAGPFDRWANGFGFDYFYGFNGGDMNHWNPTLYENRNLVPASTDPNYYLTTDLADKSIAWVRKVKSISPDRPFFLYVAPGATHAPHHAPKEWIDKFKGKFDMGWDQYREETFARQKKLGVIPPETKLTKRSEGLPAWDSLNADQKRLYARMMEVFAGYGASVDFEMGRIIDAVKQLPGADNTLFIYIAGDNGSSAEGGLEGTLNENLFFNGFPDKWEDELKVIDELGGPKHYNHFPAAWAHAMDTPFQWTKQVASHFGGTRNPMIVSWPAKIKDKGGLRDQFMHVIDVVPTIYELTGITRADRPQRGAAGADRGDQLRVHLRRREGQEPADDAVLRDGCQPGNLSRGLDGLGPVLPALAVRSRRVRPRQAEVGALQHRRGLQPGQRRRSGKSGKAARTAGPVVGGGGEVQRPPARLARRRTV